MAGFGSLELDLTEKWTTRLGARYTHDKKEADLVAATYSPGAADPLNIRLATLVAPYVMHSQEAIDKKVTWDASLEFKPRDGALLYARAAKGFKSSSMNAGVFSPEDISTAGPETVIDYELGAKTSWLDERLQLNLAAFYYDYQDYQVVIVQEDTNALRFSNADAARVTGIEVELQAQPAERFFVRAAYGRSDGEFRSFPRAAVPVPVNQGQPLDLKGERIPRSPEYTGSLLLQYSVPLASGNIELQTDWRWTGQTNFATWVESQQLSPAQPFVPLLSAIRDGLTQQAYSVGNARIAFVSANGDFEIGAWVRNVGDKKYMVNAYPVFYNRNLVQFQGDLRTYGITLTYNFGGRSN